MKVDAQNTAAAISSYYAVPDHTTIPTVEQLIEEEGLSTNYPVKIEEDANGDPVITVYDENAECLQGQRLVKYYHGVEFEWQN